VLSEGDGITFQRAETTTVFFKKEKKRPSQKSFHSVGKLKTSERPQSGALTFNTLCADGNLKPLAVWLEISSLP
jgi:hypothetical protein